MRRSDQESVSVWHHEETRPPFFPILREDMEADVCVIGAGVAGMLTAYMLQREKKRVIVLEAWGLASGETGRTTAHLSNILDDGFARLETLFGPDGAQKAAESHRGAISLIESIIRDENIDCDFQRVTGYLFASTPPQRAPLQEEIEASRRAGIIDMEQFQQLPIENALGGEGARFPGQATLHAVKFMEGLARAFQAHGGRIYTDTRVTRVQDGERPFVETEDGNRVHAQAVVVATNTPVNDKVQIHTKQHAYRSYVVAFRIPKGSYSPFLLWDVGRPYYYARILSAESFDYLIVGGEDHRTGQADDALIRYARIEDWTRRHFSIVGSTAFQWSGQLMEPVDSLAFIGRNPGDENVYIITGDSGNGFTHAGVAAQLIPDLVMGRPSDLEFLYDPGRITLRAVPQYLRENADTPAHILTDWVAPGTIDSIDEVPRGGGGILREGLTHMAVHRDETGTVHKCSAVCQHLGCTVQWNGGEKSWDCPCHGSRYDTQGRVLNGPTCKPLEPAHNADGQAEDVSRRISEHHHF